MKSPQAQGFDKLAPKYDDLAEWMFGGALKSASTKFLGDLPKNSRILLLGGGTGYLLRKLLEESEPSEIINIDISAAMQDMSKDAVSDHPAKEIIHFFEGKVFDWTDEAQFDVVITPFVLDCIPDGELQETVKKLFGLLRHEGHWLHVDFRIPENGRNRRRGKRLAKILYFYFNWHCKLGRWNLPSWGVVFGTYPMQRRSKYGQLNGKVAAYLMIKAKET